ncbi:alpha-glucan family phosphorylase [Mangrovimicrobium sediminis]|uniref:Alpha-glucan family phosphorylase n=1 Tax=Mangrovimicrobium sediminis TaxID=2562682 RepID=A0A4Z0LVS5_9GAMM|nr:alpha-glucan family phosphorylase [Haliea sp. SAOS-164]TGD71503.1 alpha-glucan family phosphorylase [Haliea sp. SAOS-164]
MAGTRFPLEVQPRIPPALSRLADVANDLVYSWDRSLRALYVRLDRELWAECGHNPKLFLRRLPQQRLDEAASDPSYLEDYRKVMAAYDAYREHRGNPDMTRIFNPDKDLIAYFCLEFGLHESFPIYSGGLGILAGDHCKAASDLGLPFVAVGLLYQAGYFTQIIDGQGHQQVANTPSHPHDLPVVPTLTETGHQLTLDIEFPGRTLKVAVWTARAGHIDLYLLDTNLPGNSEADRRITHQLYGGDREMRLQQELVLGIGGVRALREMGLRPTVWHINEGHAAFQLLERCAYRMKEGLDFASAMELVAAGTVFTTHTPVPAGHDIFDRHLVERYLMPTAHALGLDFEQLYALGLNSGDGFNMTSLALRCTRFHNGVSRIHGNVASQMEQRLWPQVPAEENPIGHVTNGVHLQTFLARDWISLFDLRLDDWRNELLNEDYWERLEDVPDYHYWSIHKALKAELLEHVADSVKRQQRRNGTSDAVIRHMTRYLEDSDADILVMGFARRFATYKRAGMLFADPQRLARLLGDPQRPAVVIFAGKAHPNDQPGQALIKQIHDFSMQPQFIGRIILLEGYDLALARQLVAGVDVWLNTPEYPQEASGTSGQKAGLNGAVNLSVLDGWWAEGYDGSNGWGITPRGEQFDEHQRFHEEARDLMDILEHQVIPTYYDRDGGGYAPDWVALSKASMKSTIPRFNAQRMVRDYVHQYYAPARSQRLRLEADGAALARELAAWKQRVREAWPGVSMQLTVQPPAVIYTDAKLMLRVRAQLQGLDPGDVRLECLLGRQDTSGGFSVEQAVQLIPLGEEEGWQLFGLDADPQLAGLQYYQLRMYPFNPALSHPFEVGAMIWV